MAFRYRYSRYYYSRYRNIYNCFPPSDPPLRSHNDPNGPSPRVSFENQQISFRMGWYSTFQSFLFIAYVNLLSNPTPLFPEFFLPLIGFISSVLIVLGICAAIERLSQVSGFKSDDIDKVGRLYPTVMPMIIGFIWMMLLLFSLCNLS